MGEFPIHAVPCGRRNPLSIIITGSLAYDNIMNFPGYFSEHIIPEQIKKLNISFLVESMKKLRGGCASNIAYSLALLEERPTIMGTVGQDFGEFNQWLQKNKVDTSLIKVIPDDYTACCYITTDRSNNQITGFYPGAMAKAHIQSFKELEAGTIQIAIISPNDPLAMSQFIKECKELSIPFIFDPGHQIPRLSPEELREGINGSCMTILNDYEHHMVLTRTGLTEEEILTMTGMLIVTKGAEGSMLKTKTESIIFPCVKTDHVADPTGAGDAYRSAVIKGWLDRLDHQTMGNLASLVATYVVEVHGTTEHHFTLDELKERYSKNFGEELKLREG
jgi:adenosine kinase